MNNNLYQQLAENFSQEMERTVNKGGTALTYIPVSEVINRLNKVLGVDMWSFSIMRCERDAVDPDFVVAHVRIEYWAKSPGTPDAQGRLIVRDGFGGQKIKRTKQGQILDLGDEFKGAISDALKKAAQTLGVGLYLARSEEAIEAEQYMDAGSEHEAKSSMWATFVTLAKSLDGDQKVAMRDRWNTRTSGAPVPTSMDAVSSEDLEFIVSEIKKIKSGQ